MSKRKMGIFCLLLVVATMMFAACGNTKEAAAPAAPVDNTVVSEEDGVIEGTGEDAGRDTLLFAIGNEPASLNPGEYNSSTSGLAILQAYDQLVREKIGDRSVMEPMLAESWEFKDEGKQLIFQIRQGVKFQDGTDMTVEDVAFSINRAITMPAYADYAGMMDHAEVTDATHVTLFMKTPYAPIINVISTAGFSILSEDYVKKCEADGTLLGRNPMGTGPYVFKEWQTGSKLIFEANPNYWNGEPAIKHLELLIMGDATTAAIALESGDIDTLWGSDSADLPRLRANESLNIISVRSSGFYYMGMNSKAAPFDDERVRKAAQLCIDRREIIDGGADGIGWETECMTTVGYFGYQNEFKDVSQDLERAKALLVEAGYPDGCDVTMITPEESWYSRPAQVVQEQLRKGGFNVTMQIMERGSFNEKLGDRDYQMTYYGVWPSIPDADSCVYQIFHKDLANTKGLTNVANVTDPAFTELIEKGRAQTDPEERYATYGELAKLNSEHAYYVPILTSTNTICARKAVSGCYGNAGGFYRVADWSY